MDVTACASGIVSEAVSETVSESVSEVGPELDSEIYSESVSGTASDSDVYKRQARYRREASVSFSEITGFYYIH